MKGAARYLLGYDPNNLSTLPSRPGEGAKKVLIFETDGQPDEYAITGSTNLGTAGDLGPGRNFSTNTNGVTGCQNFLSMANQAKAKGILVITIGFGAAGTAGCVRRDPPATQYAPFVRDYLAAAASPGADGNQSAADFGCATAANRTSENTDGDYFFCAAQGSELAGIFRTAIAQASTSIKIVQLP